MEISALHTAILQSPKVVRFSDDQHGDNHSSSASSTSFIDDGIPNIFDNVLTGRPHPPIISSPSVISSNNITANVAPTFVEDLLPPAAAVGRRDSLEIRYQLEDETKRQLTLSNLQLKQQMEELQQENERLQRQMTVQNKEHRYAKALWNDQVLDLQVELDTTKLEHRRIKEAQEDAQLELELDHLKSQLILDEDDEDDEDGSENDDTDDKATKQQHKQSLFPNITHDTTATTANPQSHHFAKIPPRSLPNNDISKAGRKATNEELILQQQQQKIIIDELTSQQSQEKTKWESEKSQLHTLIQKMTDQVEDSRIRVEWLERELIAICPSDTDDDDDDDDDEETKKTDNQEDKETLREANHGRRGNAYDGDSSDMSEASTKRTGRLTTDASPQIFRGSTKGGSSRSTSSRRSLLAEDPPKHVLLQRLREALDSYVQIQGHQDRKIQKLTKQLKSLEKEKEMDEGMQYQQMAEMKQKISYYQHRLQQTQKTLEIQEHSRDEFHNEWTKRIEELELENLQVSQKASKWEEQCLRQTGLLKRQLSSLQDKLDHSTLQIEVLEKERVKTSSWIFSNKKKESASAKVDAMTLELKQFKEREAILEEQLDSQSTKLKAKEEALGKAHERIKVLMAYADMEESSGEISPKAS